MLTVGEILKKQRENKGYTLSQIEKELKTREKFLLAIENNNWSQFTSKVYISGIIRNYSVFLGVDPHKTLAYFYRDYEKKEDVRFKRKIADRYLTPTTKKVFITLLVIIFGLFSIYFGYQLKLFFTPPNVVILSPETNVFNKEEMVKLVGKTEKEAVITVVGERVYQNKEGIFEFNFPLKPGKNKVIIEVTGANGKTTVLKKEYIKQGEVR